MIWWNYFRSKRGWKWSKVLFHRDVLELNGTQNISKYNTLHSKDLQNVHPNAFPEASSFVDEISLLSSIVPRAFIWWIDPTG